MRVLSLFSGVGGLDRALSWHPSVMCERDPYARRILARHWPGVPLVEDVRDVGDVGAEVVVGGFPCQPHSVAGKRAASADDRDLWPEFARVVRLNRPRLVLAENVTGLLTSEGGAFFGRVLRDLDALGYAVRWDCAEAAAVGAPHRRDRVWIVAVPRESFEEPTPALGRQTAMFGEAADPEWPRAGWWSAGRLGVEGARWPRVPVNGWPTPAAADASRASETYCRGNETLLGAARRGLWPTPRSADHRSGCVSDEVFDRNARPLVEEAWQADGKPPSGLLNPDFASWLMGWPHGWTLPDGPSLADAPEPGWGAEEHGDLVYYQGRPAPRDVPLLTTVKKHRRDRLRCIGNGVVTACAQEVFGALGAWR